VTDDQSAGQRIYAERGRADAADDSPSPRQIGTHVDQIEDHQDE